mmetsp:Transcript_38462/g.110453  ORF Transcript_38462/g.110453 Transcript_38462/m.110453 type:complete len:217 (+) Transcript_38462:339-989(+)
MHEVLPMRLKGCNHSLCRTDPKPNGPRSSASSMTSTALRNACPMSQPPPEPAALSSGGEPVEEAPGAGLAPAATALASAAAPAAPRPHSTSLFGSSFANKCRAMCDTPAPPWPSKTANTPRSVSPVADAENAACSSSIAGRQPRIEALVQLTFTSGTDGPARRLQEPRSMATLRSGIGPSTIASRKRSSTATSTPKPVASRAPLGSQPLPIVPART